MQEEKYGVRQLGLAGAFAQKPTVSTCTFELRNSILPCVS